MRKINIRQIYPHLLIFLAFVLISYLYFPDILEGKVINQSDISSWKGAAHEIQEYRATTGEEALWTGSMFSGMPSTTISQYHPGNYTAFFFKILQLFKNPAGWLIIAMLGFYLLLLCFKINRWLAAAGAIAFAFCSYNFEIIQVGHATKMNAIAYMPWVLASIVYAYRHHPLLGMAFTGIAMSLELQSKHPQITYYVGIIVLFYVLAEAYTAIKQKTVPRFIKTSLLVLAGLLLGAGSNVNSLWPTVEYGKYTMRGGSELTNNKDANATGLTKEYATAWSYGIEETPNLLIPNFNGGASGGALSKKSETYKTLRQGGARNAEQMIKQMPTYWGPQAFTAGPMYMGAITVFLFILGLALIREPLKWWLAAVSLLAVLLAWGQHFMWLTGLFHDYVPLYNKFRVPSMILVILQLTLPLLGFYTVNKIWNGNPERKTVVRGMKIALGITAGFCALFALLPSLAGSFTSNSDSQYPEWLQQTLPLDRASLLRADAFRSLIFILLGATTIWAGYTKKLKMTYAIGLLALFILIDLWTVDKRYLSSDHFVSPREFNQAFQARPVDKEILKDRDPDYRVLDLTVNTFNDSHVSYFHKTIGGYSAAKMQRYQDLIDYHLLPEMQSFIRGIQNQPTPTALDSMLNQLPVLNMLNTRYIIVNPNGMPVQNPKALGNAWFVKNYRTVKSANEEIMALKTIHPAQTAVINEEYLPLLPQQTFLQDTSAFIRLTSYSPNQLEYEYRAASPQLAVFSEIYYPAGWKAYIDDKEAPHFRANYILRSMVLPAGTHNVKFIFAPQSYYTGAWISRICSGLLLLLLVGGIVYKFKITP